VNAATRSWLPTAALAALAAASGCGSTDDGDAGRQASGAQSGVEGPQRTFPAGRWQGRLAQRGRLPFGISVTIRVPFGGRPSTVRYNGIECSGRWKFLGRSGEDFRFRELIEVGAGGACSARGIVTLRYISRDRMRYELRGAGAPISGFLRHRGPTAPPPPA
jgi:hypothetical protein